MPAIGVCWLSLRPVPLSILVFGLFGFLGYLLCLAVQQGYSEQLLHLYKVRTTTKVKVIIPLSQHGVPA